MDPDTDRGHDQDVDIFATAEEAARVVGVSARTVRRWINAGDIQSAESDRGRLVSVSDVRRHAVGGHGLTRPPLELPRTRTRTRTVADTNMAALVSAVSGTANLQMVAIAKQIERLSREAMAANQRADDADRKLEEASAEVERLREILGYRSHDAESGHNASG